MRCPASRPRCGRTCRGPPGARIDRRSKNTGSTRAFVAERGHEPHRPRVRQPKPPGQNCLVCNRRVGVIRAPGVLVLPRSFACNRGLFSRSRGALLFFCCDKFPPETTRHRHPMAIYRNHILPHLIRLAMRNRDLVPYRERSLSDATGRVLEVGIGSGANLPFYGEQTRELIGLEPSARLLAMTRQVAAQSALPVTLLEASAEDIPLESGSVDTVVMTWTLCSIPDAGRALREIRRVLDPEGRLLFVEHGLAPDERVQRWQRRLSPWWKHLAGGCRLDRAMNVLIENAGFRIERLDTGYMRGPRPFTFMYEGMAVAR
jgi:SAM-dependent methyltransferase